MSMANIFISYSRESEAITRNLADAIKKLEFTVWFDQELSGTQMWWEKILENIRKCDLFIYVLSTESLKSSACKREYGYATDLSKTILPVLISGELSLDLLPLELSRVQFVDYQKRDHDSALRLAKALNAAPPSMPLPNPLPTPPDIPISYLSGLAVKIDSKTRLTDKEQINLIGELRRSLKNSDTERDAFTLLERLRARKDLLATNAEEVDELINTTKLPYKALDTEPVTVNRLNPEIEIYKIKTGDNSKKHYGGETSDFHKVTEKPRLIFKIIIIIFVMIVISELTGLDFIKISTNLQSGYVSKGTSVNQTIINY